jgi:hypothetical protein
MSLGNPKEECRIAHTVNYIGIAIETVVSIDVGFIAGILLPELGVATNALLLTTIVESSSSNRGHFKHCIIHMSDKTT